MLIFFPVRPKSRREKKKKKRKGEAIAKLFALHTNAIHGVPIES